jgi:methionyl-tRNA synthetase
VLALIGSGLRDFSVSRSRARAHGWGIPVPGDPDQVVYVWWDALGNYVTSLSLGEEPSADFERWWAGEGERVHLLGKGVLRFHAVYWPAMLLSARLSLPTRVFVHDYVTVSGRKISKSGGTGVDPAELVARYGTDAVRCWLLREVPRVGDVDFTEERLIVRADADLAGGFGNLVHRVITMVHRYRDGVVPKATIATTATSELRAVCTRASGRVDAALDDFDCRAAAGAVWTLVEEANRCIDRTRPWELAKAERAGGSPAPLDAALAALVQACRALGEELRPFLPGAAQRITERCTPVDGVLPPSKPLFARLGG